MPVAVTVSVIVIALVLGMVIAGIGRRPS